MRLEEWKFSFDLAWDDPWCKWQSIGTGIFMIAGLGYLLQRIIRVGLENSLVIFHYNIYLGIDEVQHWTFALAYAGILIAVVLLNILLSFFLFRYDKIASRTLLFAGTVFAIIFLIAANAIVAINT
ncbi:MAG: hypothetical protein WC477_01065 [Patescibacteria group bacterium]